MNGRDSHRALIIGLDVGDGALLLEWARRGHLPVLASLIERGAWSWLDTTADLLHVSAWPSIYTGAHPGEHGVYYTFQAAPGRQGYAKFGAGQYGRPSFWSLLSRAAVRCTVFDAPYTHPEPASAAVQVFEWGTWAQHWRPMSTPAALFRRLRRECGRYPLGIEALDIGLAPLDAGDMQRRLVDSVRAKSEAAAWLMGRSPWDLFFMVYGETHPGAHYLWARPEGQLDRSRGGSGPEEPAGRTDPHEDPQARLRSVYEEIDRGIGKLLERAGEQVSVYVISGDGVGPNHGGWHLLPEVLRRLGFLVESGGGAPSIDPAHGAAARAEAVPNGASTRAPAAEGGGRPPTGRPERGVRDPIRRLRDALPRDFRKALARKLPSAVRHRLARRVDMAGIDWSSTRAFCLPTDLEGYIRVNLRGREPQGIVSPGAEYRAVCHELAEALHALQDPDSGRPAVRRVVQADDALAGPRRHHLPDLIVTWNDERPLTALASAQIDSVSGPSPDARSGTHAPRGFLLRCGPGVVPAGIVTGGHVCDLAPRLLARFGVDIPDYMRRSVPATDAPSIAGPDSRP